MGANFPRLKVWTTTEDVTAGDLNAEFNNILDNLTASGVGGFSSTVLQMQSTVDPGEVGSENLATSVAGEVQRLRFMLKEITGEDEWYESPVASLAGLANAIGTGLTDNRLVSGRVRSAGTNNMPIFLVPNGAAKTVTVKGSTTNFIYYINGVEYSISTDVNLINLTAAPASNNTCLVNESGALDDEYTKYTGENGGVITVDNMGSEISSLVGSFAAFRLAGLATEYFLGYVKSTTEISKCFRGYFFDSLDAPSARSAYTDNDVITLMKLTWIFAKTDETLTATYNNPVWAKDEPTSPALGDYWFDIATNKWKVYGVGAYTDADAHLIGVCFQDTTNTVGARSFEFFANYNAQNSLELVYDSATQVKARFPGSTVNVWGQTIKSDRNLRIWDITLHRDAGVSESASTYYYAYLTDSGDVVISDVRPYDRRADLLGFYHPAASWRCVGQFYNDGSSNISAADVVSYYVNFDAALVRNASGPTRVEVLDKRIVFTGTTSSEFFPPAAQIKGQSFELVHAGTSLTQVYTLTGFNGELIGAANTYVMYTAGETLRVFSNGTALIPLSHYAQTSWVNAGVVVITSVGGGVVKGTTTTDEFWWRRDGSDLLGRYSYKQTVAGTSGTSDYLYAIPANMTIDTTKITAFSTVSTGAVIHPTNTVGYAQMYTSTGPTIGSGSVVAYDSTKFRLLNGQTSIMNSGTTFALGGTTVTLNAEMRLPMLGWQP